MDTCLCPPVTAAEHLVLASFLKVRQEYRALLVETWAQTVKDANTPEDLALVQALGALVKEARRDEARDLLTLQGSCAGFRAANRT